MRHGFKHKNDHVQRWKDLKVHEKVAVGPPDRQDWLWVEEKSQWPTVINETYKDSKGHGQGTQVIDRKV
jgi:hypothetical protein